MINRDDLGDIWITRLSDNEVTVIIDGNCHSNNMLAVHKGEPTKVLHLPLCIVLSATCSY